jgi:hypothetical protein
MNLSIRITGLRIGLALAAISAVPALHAAGPASMNTSAPSALTASAPSIFNTTVPDPTRDVRYESAGMSSSDNAVEAADPSASLTGERDSLGEHFDGEQPSPGRRRYGRSRYQDRLHNADGSTKIAFMAGAGLNMPVGNTGKYYTPSYTFGVGAGWNFNKTFGVLGEFHYDHMGLTGGSINTEYNNLLTVGFQQSDLEGFDANAHVFSLTVDPIINFTPRGRSGKLGGYVTGGVGFYHKTTNFTLPQVGESCSFFCVQFIENVNIDSASANSFGTNVGFGLTYKLSEFSSERLFVDARYNWLPISSNNNNDFFPFNRRNSEYIPITVGIRF